jgi:alanyl-tRNA synthetase
VRIEQIKIPEFCVVALVGASGSGKSTFAETDSISEGESGMIILSNTPFYAERGGQVGDRGVIEGCGASYEVENTLFPSGEMTAHVGRVSSGEIKAGMKLTATVDSNRRDAIRRHHTATHLLHEALIRVLGKHVRQAGSLVTPDFLRFDFNHFGPLSPEEIREVESIVYGQVLRAEPVRTSVMSFDDARKLGVKALFEEKYGDIVRMLEVQGFSTELCGGTHVSNTGEIGLVKIVRDEGIGTGVRRINALAGTAALATTQDAFWTLRSLADLLGCDAESIVTRIGDLLGERKALERKNQEFLLRSASEGMSARLDSAIRIGDVALVIDSFRDTPRDLLRQIGDRIKQAEPCAVVLLASVEGESVTLAGMATDDAVKRGAHAGNLVKEIALLMGGSGGGKPATGQGGAKDSSKLKEALVSAERVVKSQLMHRI